MDFQLDEPTPSSPSVWVSNEASFAEAEKELEQIQRVFLMVEEHVDVAETGDEAEALANQLQAL